MFLKKLKVLNLEKLIFINKTFHVCLLAEIYLNGLYTFTFQF